MTELAPPDGSAAAPPDADERRAAPAVICYRVDQLPPANLAAKQAAAAAATVVDEVLVPPRDAQVVPVKAGQLFRITSVEGPQVGDLNLWNADDLTERFFSGKTRQLHATHVSVGDRLWSTLPHLRPLATIVADTLAWYGWDDDGGGVHDVIGTRCDPYTNRLLNDVDYHYCCHSNLSRALADTTGMAVTEAELLVHDVLNVFMCTGFTADTHQYFMKASPVRPGDHLEFFAETDLLVGLSTCPGGDCSSTHSDDATACYPLLIEIRQPADPIPGWQPPSPPPYPRTHGAGR